MAISPASWEEACSAAGSYDSSVLNRFRLERSLGRKPDGSFLTHSVLGLVLRLLGKSDPLITDFGGATGDLGADLYLTYPRATYTVVENSALVELVGAKLRGVLFSDTLPPSCDVFFSSSTLQYLKDPLSIVRAAAASTQTAIVLVRNCFSDRQRFSVQRSPLFDNGAGPIPAGWQNREISYPHRTLIETDLISLVESYGFVCIANLEEHSGAAMHGTYGRQLVFWRNAPSQSLGQELKKSRAS
jgi:putative methyltransferase (TIGR04325 family)